MMGVDAENRTEEMFGGMGVALIQRKFVRPLCNGEVFQFNRCNHSAATAAHKAIAVTRVDKAVRQIDFDLYCTAMATAFVHGVKLNTFC